MADWKSVKSISDKYGISVERVIAWVRESQITTSVVGSVVLIDDGSVCELVEKETSISRVAASEMERGQTVVRAQRGSDRIIDSVILAERFWESLPERVKAP